MRAAFCAALFLLTACAPRQGLGPSRGGDLCNAQAYQDLLGLEESAAKALPQPKRVFHITDALTTDLQMNRLNVQLDDSGTIGAIFCG
ncbi:MAG: I78 family peptidase inhibitor [Sulfitobacter sp.]